MMKKLLLFVAVAILLPMVVMANTDLLRFTPTLEKWGPKHGLIQQQLQARIDLPNNQKIMGHYCSDSLSSEGFAMMSSGLMPIAAMLEPDELDVFQGGKIVAFRVGLVEPAEIARVFVIPVTAQGKYGDKTEWMCSVGDAGWNMVELETPYEINLAENEKLLIGFYYKQTADGKPLSLVKLGQPYDYYTYRKVGSSGKWRPLEFIENGNLSIQCIVEKDDFPEYRIASYDLQSIDFVQIGDELPFILKVKNKGIKTVEANTLTVKVMIDGQEVTTVTNADAFYDEFYSLKGLVPTGGLASGDHVMSVQVVSVAGVPQENMPVYEYAFKAYQHGFPRQKHLVEQLTSTYCTYCPLGNSMLSILTSKRDDIIWVGIHGNLGSGVDPYRSNQGDTIMSYLTGGSISYPSGAFDRMPGWDDPNTIVNGLGYYEQYHELVAEYLGEFFDYISESTPTFAEIKGNCRIDEATRKATVTISGELSTDFNLMMGEDATLTVYLVEDSLIAPQLNLGTWVNKYQHNGVFRKALNSVFGSKLNIIGNHYHNTYSVTIPNTWNWENMRVVAFISRPMKNAVTGFTDMFVNNADCFSFKVGADDPVKGDVNGDNEVNIADVNEVIAAIISADLTNPAVDVTEDGEVNIADVNAVINIILK